MLERQVDDFGSRDRFTDAVLGLLGATERVRALVELPAARRPPVSPTTAAIADVLLGMISVGPSLRATLGFAGAEPAAASEPDHRACEDGGTDDRILR